MMTSETATVVAPAKLTLRLHITGVRHDGYHLIDSEMVSISLCDTVTIDPTVDPGGDRLIVTGRYAAGVPAGADNLVSRALALAGRKARVTIDKQIPHGGGLGGGSTDAAAVLRWAGVSDPAVAATVGADVAFCLVGGRARVTGIGEVIESLPFQGLDVTLVIPPLQVSTPAAYAMWDSLGGPQDDVSNQLESAAIAVNPELARWRDRIGDACGSTPVLAGSGATWFVLGEHEGALAALSDEGAHVVAARTVPSDRGAVRRQQQ